MNKKIIFITGGARSGKSYFAQEIAREFRPQSTQSSRRFQKSMIKKQTLDFLIGLLLFEFLVSFISVSSAVKGFYE